MPARGKLLPGVEHSINISFNPKNFGVFNTQMNLELLAGIYEIPLKLMGMANEIGDRQKQENQYITENEADNPISQVQKQKKSQ